MWCTHVHLYMHICRFLVFYGLVKSKIILSRRGAAGFNLARGLEQALILKERTRYLQVEGVSTVLAAVCQVIVFVSFRQGQRSEPEFLNLLKRPGIDSQHGGFPAWRNRFRLGLIPGLQNVYTFGLRIRISWVKIKPKLITAKWGKTEFSFSFRVIVLRRLTPSRCM